MSTSTPSPDKKFLKSRLTKLSIVDNNKQQQVLSHLSNVLKRNNLEIKDEEEVHSAQQMDSLFRALSGALFLNPNKKEEVIELCKKYLRVHCLKKVVAANERRCHRSSPSCSKSLGSWSTTVRARNTPALSRSRSSLSH